MFVWSFGSLDKDDGRLMKRSCSTSMVVQGSVS